MKLKMIAAATMLAACGIAAHAQTPPPPPPANMMRQMPMPEGGMRERFEQHMQEHVQERMQHRMESLKRILQVTPNQEGAWQAWAAAMRPAQPMMMQRHQRGEFEHLTTPERIDRLRQLRAQRDAEMDRRGEATKVFYAQLTGPQQKAFDEISMKFLKGGHGHRGGRWGHGGW